MLLPIPRERSGCRSPLVHVGLLGDTIVQEIGRISRPEEDSLQHLPNIGMGPMFAENVGRIDLPWEMAKDHNLCGYSMADPVIGQGMVAFAELGVWDRRTGNHRFVVTEHVGFGVNGNAKVSKGVTEIDDLINGNAGSREFRSIGGRLWSCLLLGETVNRSLVQ